MSLPITITKYQIDNGDDTDNPDVNPAGGQVIVITGTGFPEKILASAPVSVEITGSLTTNIEAVPVKMHELPSNDFILQENISEETSALQQKNNLVIEPTSVAEIEITEFCHKTTSLI